MINIRNRQQTGEKVRNCYLVEASGSTSTASVKSKTLHIPSVFP